MKTTLFFCCAIALISFLKLHNAQTSSIAFIFLLLVPIIALLLSSHTENVKHQRNK